MTPRIVLTAGEPAGIGPDIILMAANRSWPAECIFIGDADILAERAAALNLPFHPVPFAADASRQMHQPGTLKIIPVAQAAPVKAGEFNPLNASYVLACLKTAVVLSQKKMVDALVTGPVHKGLMQSAGCFFQGHTEYLAELTETPHPVMFFVAPGLKVALVTTHLALQDVPRAITPLQLSTVFSVLQKDLQTKFHLHAPRILVCGLNPHAGEQGYLGREEIDTIIPVLNDWRERGMHLIGPVSADTAFTQASLKNVDVVLAMYHDQALPVVKYASFGSAVNITLGLPMIRTSVDHGVAMDLAGTGQADPCSLIAAIQLAIDLSTGNKR